MTRPGAPMKDLLSAAAGPDFQARAYDDVDVRIMQAGLEILAERGTRSATTSQIAERAGVGRATLHRRFATKDELFQHALSRELRTILTSFGEVLATPLAPAEQTAEAFALCIRALRRPPFHHGSAARRAELASAFTEGAPSLFDRGRDVVAAAIAAQQAAGVLPPGEPQWQADALMHVIVGYYLLPASALDLDDEQQVLQFAERFISPILLRR
ncbi:TetR/AcrR family transcriptional regulator [Mycolicibacterium flavescens]|uniref:HTH tetR-type domain-containing protein n=1 Tax=Mycolicibacterium flavescens TaxID=1776 RepID=A0A1E3RF14_MYCFV|nr:TetR/AcrR family transcriptional regulator [Mycolicibacterium flavescens]MCV7278706.1 TetR/AcrR family transcriptional regulator [Mycolicibacterium flavescens]ODQ88458.1 hypothetical protein BHQ18_18420 [Mycolicibacterium flavescens]